MTSYSSLGYAGADSSVGATKGSRTDMSVSVSVSTPKAPKADHSLPKLLEEVEVIYSKANTLTAEFSQINDNAALGTKKKSSGKIFVKRPSKVRWETLHPDVSFFISDGSHSWFYTPPFSDDERGQLIEKKSSAVQSKLANALLSGSFSMARDMKITQKSPSTFLLVPKPRTAGTVTQATIQIDPALKLIQKVILDHKGGNHTEISLDKIELGPILKDDLFRFQAPPNTDREE